MHLRQGYLVIISPGHIDYYLYLIAAMPCPCFFRQGPVALIMGTLRVHLLGGNVRSHLFGQDDLDDQWRMVISPLVGCDSISTSSQSILFVGPSRANNAAMIICL